MPCAQMCCRGGLVFPADDSTSSSGGSGDGTPVVVVSQLQSVLAFHRSEHLVCDTPHYVFLGAVLPLLSVAVFVRLPALVKLAFLAMIGAGFALAVEVVNRRLFVQFDRQNPLRSLIICP